MSDQLAPDVQGFTVECSKTRPDAWTVTATAHIGHEYRTVTQEAHASVDPITFSETTLRHLLAPKD